MAGSTPQAAALAAAASPLAPARRREGEVTFLALAGGFGQLWMAYSHTPAPPTAPLVESEPDLPGHAARLGLQRARQEAERAASGAS